MAAIKALQQWCKIQCEGYRDVAITNMTTSFRDGLAFCALIHKHRPDLIDFDSLRKENVYDNNHLAFRVAEEQLGIPALLDAEDMVALRVPDRLSILTYVSQYYNYFHGRSPIGGMGGIKRPAENSTEEPSGKKNQAVTAKVFPSPTPPTENKREALAERSNKQGTLSSSCNACHKHVHLVQRHLVDGKLYHRNCFKCSQCSSVLLSGTYECGKEPGTFICKSHQNAPSSSTNQSTVKSPGSHTSHISVSPKSTRAFPSSKATVSSPTSQNSLAPAGSAGKTGPASSKLGPSWLTTKTEHTPTPAPRFQPTASPRSETVTVTVTVPSKRDETPKPPSISTQRNQDARKRFFDSEDSVSIGSDPKATGAGGGAGGGRVFLKVDNMSSDKEKEKENAKSVIGKMVTEETNKSSGALWRPVGQKTNNSSNVSPVDNKVNTGRVRLKAPDIDLDVSSPPSANKAPAWVRTKDKETSRPASALLTNNKENETAPSDWRSMLKPIRKDDTTAGSKGSSLGKSETKKPENSSPRPWAPSSGPSPASLATPSPAPSAGGAASGPDRLKAPSPSPEKKAPEPWGTKNGSVSSTANSAGTQTPKLHKGKPDYIPKEEIFRELKEIETNLNELEKKGIEMEKQLRRCEEEGEEDTLMNDLMVDWFNLIRNKQLYMRRESELVYIARTQDLEEEQPSVEAELRKLMDKPEHLKTASDRKREEELMAKLMEIVNDRNAIIDGLDEDRLREEEEDEQLNKMMQSLDIKKDKNKKKSPISKWFGRKSKKESGEKEAN
ncbi:protein-methionine sulfoxide oxidase mical2b [Chanos chanos]|uniref:Protein-methionine sulfoxide oxidase mical2b n=1 Tax=Chanos chanos TaxID=29144 RepID=A0A6J2VVY5_CHACN|nr:MICAL-like protein 2 [Chanos chanos]